MGALTLSAPVGAGASSPRGGGRTGLRAIFSECSSQEWIDIAARLAERHGWVPCYWTGNEAFGPVVRERFQGVVFHHNYNAARGIPPEETAELPMCALDQELLQDLAVHESTVVSMMDRMDSGHAFSHRERVRLYHRYLMYWSAVLDHLKPDVFVTPGVPHLAYDYVLYVLCLKRGVRTVLTEYTSVTGLVLAMERFEEGSTEVRAAYRESLARHQGGTIALSPAAESHWREITGDYAQGMPFYMKDQYGHASGEAKPPRKPAFWRPILGQVVGTTKVFRLWRYPTYLRNAWRNFVRSPFERWHRDAFVPIESTNLKIRGKSIRVHMTAREHRLYMRHSRRQVRRLRERYLELVEDVDLSRPYVYVALHYQPERSTSPSGGAFVDQVLMVDLLSKCLPPGWSLYVKEHLAQLLPFQSGQLCRSPEDYDALRALPGVKLVSLSLTSFDLIDSARAVVTVSGTAGWEAVSRGKPVLAFGHAWYQGCEGVFYTPTVRECRQALLRIADGFKVDREKVRLFLHVLEQVGFKGYFDSDFARVAGLSPEENAVAVSEALVRFVSARSPAA